MTSVLRRVCNLGTDVGRAIVPLFVGRPANLSRLSAVDQFSRLANLSGEQEAASFNSTRNSCTTPYRPFSNTTTNSSSSKSTTQFQCGESSFGELQFDSDPLPEISEIKLNLLKNPKAALDSINRLEAVVKKFFPPNGIDNLRCLSWKAQALWKTGKYSESWKVLEEINLILGADDNLILGGYDNACGGDNASQKNKATTRPIIPDSIKSYLKKTILRIGIENGGGSIEQLNDLMSEWENLHTSNALNNPRDYPDEVLKEMLVLNRDYKISNDSKFSDPLLLIEHQLRLGEILAFSQTFSEDIDGLKGLAADKILPIVDYIDTIISGLDDPNSLDLIKNKDAEVLIALLWSKTRAYAAAGHILMCAQQIVSSEGIFRTGMGIIERIEMAYGNNGLLPRQLLNKKKFLASHRALLERWEKREADAERVEKAEKEIQVEIQGKLNLLDFIEDFNMKSNLIETYRTLPMGQVKWGFQEGLK